ncbi:MAG: TetR/AcrR family transcriptional regulator [Deltaproteobacteria bacterium]|jgi:AcrR family transcriptional regulator|nr:TetR/AcrR family transcriptional regulator [Deltaproteobacteria bacterium]MBW2496236.1 TetR/AcrR family transcriptional regulator [Deltaproteobacteria bacterium]
MPRPSLEDARTRILAAGLTLFARRGTERVNSNAIARRAGLGIGTFYKHFPDKYALLHEIGLRTLAGIQQARRDAVARAGPDPVSQVDHAIRAVVRFAERHPDAYRVSFGRERIGSAGSQPVVSESSRPTARALAALQQRGRLDPDLDVELAARAHAAMEVSTLLWWLENPSRAPAEDLVDTLVRLHPAVACRIDAG